MDKIWLYGFDKDNRVRIYYYIRKKYMSITAMKKLIEKMLDREPAVSEIVAIDDYIGLKQDFIDTVKDPHFTKDIEFKDLVERTGRIQYKR